MIEYRGNTPIKKIDLNIDNINVFLKDEGKNITGSMKDRAARFCIDRAFEKKVITKESTIIESSSGNMGIALAKYCNEKSLKFLCVVDPNINKVSKELIIKYGGKIVEINEPDAFGGYLVSRLNYVSEYLSKNENVYWTNQYNNLDVIQGYFGLVDELCIQLPKIDYIFVSVSSGGSIAGISKRMKSILPNTKTIAVDVEGSVALGGKPAKRYLPGAGASIVPSNLKEAFIDDVIVVNEFEAVNECLYYQDKYDEKIGGSSGLVLAGIKKYFKNQEYSIKEKENVVAIFADQGSRYDQTIYNSKWRQCIFHMK